MLYIWENRVAELIVICCVEKPIISAQRTIEMTLVKQLPQDIGASLDVVVGAVCECTEKKSNRRTR